MIVTLDKVGSVQSLEQTIDNLSSQANIASILVLSCDENNYQSNELNPILKSLDKPIFGGIFPQIIYKDENLSKGNIVVGLEKEVSPVIIENISEKTIELEDEIEDKFKIEDEPKTMFVFVDGLSKTIAVLINELYNYFGVENNYIGGGAGSLSFIQKPCIITNKGLLEDAAILVNTQIESGIGVKHGWEKIAGPFQITKSDKNIIKELDYKPAFEVYKNIVEEHSGKVFDDTNFFDIAKAYPFGINKFGNENIVRDPITTENGSLICVGEVQEGAYTEILKGEKSSLINAAKNAYSTAQKNLKEENSELTIFIDCISRVLFLDKDFKEELSVIPNDKPLIGALTLGEIANSGQDYLEFYNKTAVVCVL